MKRVVVLVLLLITAAGAGMKQHTQGPSTRSRRASAKPAAAAGLVLAQDDKKLENELVAKYGEGQRERIRRRLKQVAQFWRAEDGDRAVFDAFVKANFACDQATLDQVGSRAPR